MDERDGELDWRITERIEQLSATQRWPWQEPAVESVALDDEGRVTRCLATEMGAVVLGHLEP